MDSEGNLTILDRVKIASEFHRLITTKQEQGQAPENGTSETDQPTLRFRPMNAERLSNRFLSTQRILDSLERAEVPKPDLRHQRVSKPSGNVPETSPGHGIDF